MLETRLICDHCKQPMANEAPGYFALRLAEAPRRFIIDFGTMDDLGYHVSDTTKLLCSEKCLFIEISNAMDIVYGRKLMVGEQT